MQADRVLKARCRSQTRKKRRFSVRQIALICSRCLIELSSESASNSGMLSRSVRLLSVILALILGSQNAAFATGMHCANSPPAIGPAETSAHQHHAAASLIDPDSGSIGAEARPHDHHAAGHGSEVVSNNADSLSCPCGPGCAMPSCVGTGAGLGGPMLSSKFTVDADVFASDRRRVAARAAFTSDLIRPPSRS